MKHKINDVATTLVEKLEDKYTDENFYGELQDLYDEFEYEITKYCKTIYPEGETTIWDYDPEYDNMDLEEKVQDILEYICGKTVLDANMCTLNDVLLITVVTKGV